MAEYYEHEPANLFIAKNGDWFNNGVKVIHERIYKLFNLSLRTDGEGGYYLEIGRETCPVTVEDTPYVVRGVFYENTEEGDIFHLTLNDDRVTPLDVRTLRARGDNELRCRVFDGVFEAAFAPTAMQQIAPYLEHDQSTGAIHIEFNGEKFLIEKA